MAEQLPPESRADATPIPHWYAPNKHLPTITHGEGARIFDDEGNDYLDFVSQLYCVNAGHSNDAIRSAMKDQLDRIPFVSPTSHNDTRSELASKLADIAPGDLSEVYFSISGSEANESAVQIARKHTGGRKILTRWRSYHGSTYGAGSLTAEPTTRNNLEQYAATTGAVKFLPPLATSHQSPFPSAETPAELAEQAADHLEFVIRNEGSDSIAAILTEPIAGSSGAYPAPPGYFQRVRELCDEYDILLISDEVITGFGRCGDWFGIGTEDVVPDMLTFAKGVTSAYAPLAGVMMNPEVATSLHESGHDLGQTFGGHPLGCAAGVAAIDEYGNGLIDNAREIAPVLESRLRDLESKWDVVGDVHGRGLLWSVEFTDPETGEPFFLEYVDDAEEKENPVLQVQAATKDRGVVFFPGRPMTQLLCAPPLCIDEDDVEEAVSALDGGIEEIFG